MNRNDAFPLVSVVLPVRNGMPFLPEAIESIWAQTMRNFELIVVNDGSTDGTLEYLRSINDTRLRILESTGRGAGSAQRTGIEAARASLIARMDADDVSLPARFEQQLQHLLNSPCTVAVGTQIRYIAGGRTIPAFRFPCDHVSIRRDFRLGRAPVCNSSMIFRVEAARNVRTRINGPGEDFDFYLRLAGLGEIENLGFCLHLARLDEGSVSFARAAEQQFEIDFAIACDRARSNDIPEPDLDSFHRSWVSRPIFKRIETHMRIWHKRCYRRSLMYHARGRTVLACSNLMAAAALRPASALYRIRHLRLSSS